MRCPSVRYVEHRRPVEFFEEKALFYLSVDDLTEMRKRVDERYRYEKRSRNPIFLDFEDDPPPSVDMADLFEDVGRTFGTDGDSTLGPREPYLLNEDGTSIVVLAKPIGFASDLSFAEGVTSDVRGAIESLDLSSYGSDFSVAYTGRYVKKPSAQQAQITRDLGVASSVALLMVVAFLTLLFRRIGAVVFVLAPVLTGLVWTFGFMSVAFGELNLLTGFVGAILMGIGIDYGIYLLRGFQTEVGALRDPRVAIERTFAETGRAVLVAAFTTVSAFVGLGLSQFRAFHEFGVVAAVGTVFVVASYALLFPAFVALLWRDRDEEMKQPARIEGWRPWAPALLAIFVFASSLAVSQADRLRFDYDFSALDDTNLPEFETDRQVNDILGYSQTPLVVLTDNAEQQRKAVASIRQRMAALGDRTTVDFVASVTDLVPDQQAEKKAILDKLQRTLKKVKPEWLDDADRDEFESLKTASMGEPFDTDQLPPLLTRPFMGSAQDSEHGFVLVFPAISLSDGSRIVDFADELTDLPIGEGRQLSAAGEAMVLADVLSIVVGESPRILAIAGLLVVVGMRLILGSMRLAVLGLAVPFLTLFASAGVLGLAGLPLNYLNVMVIPVLFGLSVDGGVHLVLSHEAGVRGSRLAGEIGPAVVGAVITSGFGFGALLLAHHAGLNSVGRLMLVGLAVNLLTCLVGVLPMLEVVDRARERLAPYHGLAQRVAALVATGGFLNHAPHGAGWLSALLAVPVAVWLSGAPVPVKLVVVVGALAAGWWSLKAISNASSEHLEGAAPIAVWFGALVATGFHGSSVLVLVGAVVVYMTLAGIVERRMTHQKDAFGSMAAHGAVGLVTALVLMFVVNQVGMFGG